MRVKHAVSSMAVPRSSCHLHNATQRARNHAADATLCDGDARPHLVPLYRCFAERASQPHRLGINFAASACMPNGCMTTFSTAIQLGSRGQGRCAGSTSTLLHERCGVWTGLICCAAPAYDHWA